MHSTFHAVNNSVNHILNKVEEKNYVIGIFIDLSKAFDTIEHNKSHEKLMHYGIRGMPIKSCEATSLAENKWQNFRRKNKTNVVLSMEAHEVQFLDPYCS